MCVRLGIGRAYSFIYKYTMKDMNRDLLYKYVENTATDAETEQVLDWLDADPAHQRELDEIDWVLAASILHETDVRHQSPAETQKRVRPLRRIVRYATELAAVVAVSIGLSWVLTEKRVDEWLHKTTTLEVPKGHYMNMKLQDGTTVWLSSGSVLEYPLIFGRDERRVKVSGEAMFDVEHNAHQPFIVETFAYDIEVLGTKFDVVAYRNEKLFSTAVLRGSVRVTNRLIPAEQFILKANDKVRLAGKHLESGKIDDFDDYLWTEGVISIKGLSFEELMMKFERTFGVKIIIDRSRMPVINYNRGKVRISDGIDSALRLLQLASDFSYSRDEEVGTIVIR